MKTIAFSHPRRGLEGSFATFRLGARWAETLAPGDEVDLIDARTKRALKRATVVSVTVGQFAEMASTHGHAAHNWQHLQPHERPAALIESMRRRFRHWGEARTSDQAPCSVIHLRISDVRVPD